MVQSRWFVLDKGESMRIVLCAIDQPLADAWKAYCGELDGVEIHQGNILDLRVDAVVSPANSFGFMDGGIDMIYSQHFGWQVQERLQKLIRQEHDGELLVGKAEIVETKDNNIPYLIAAPTMRVPMVLSDSVNPYLAARAALLLVRNGLFPDGDLEGERISDGVKSMAIPGLGTGVGRVAPEKCALQVRNAIKDVVREEYEFPHSWAEAQVRHQQMYASKIRDLQY